MSEERSGAKHGKNGDQTAGGIFRVKEEGDGQDRVKACSVHRVRSVLLTQQAAALGLPLIRVELPHPSPNEAYEARFTEACAGIKAQGVEHIVFGDLFLARIMHHACVFAHQANGRAPTVRPARSA